MAAVANQESSRLILHYDNCTYLEGGERWFPLHISSFSFLFFSSAPTSAPMYVLYITQAAVAFRLLPSFMHGSSGLWMNYIRNIKMSDANVEVA